MTGRERIKRIIFQYGFADLEWQRKQKHKLKHLGNDKIDALISEFYILEAKDLAIKRIFGELPCTPWDPVMRHTDPIMVNYYTDLIFSHLKQGDNGAQKTEVCFYKRH